MELCKGGDFFDYLYARSFKLEEKHVARFVHQICTAIYYIHNMGIVHRDLKPENIIVTDKSNNANLKILDFGLSLFLGPGEYFKENVGTIVHISL